MDQIRNFATASASLAKGARMVFSLQFFSALLQAKKQPLWKASNQKKKKRLNQELINVSDVKCVITVNKERYENLFHQQRLRDVYSSFTALAEFIYERGRLKCWESFIRS